MINAIGKLLRCLACCRIQYIWRQTGQIFLRFALVAANKRKRSIGWGLRMARRA